MYRKRLNKNAASFSFQNTNISKALKEFFRVLFTLWETDNVEHIISMVSITTMNEADLFFKELFINAYQLAAGPDLQLNCLNIVQTIDTLDLLLPQMVIEKLNVSSDSFLLTYDNIKENAFNEYFRRIQASFELFREIKISIFWANESNSNTLKTILKEINEVLKVLTQICQIKYFHLLVYNFCQFLRNMMYQYNDLSEIKLTLLITFSNISYRMAKFLLWKIDTRNNLEASKFILYLFQTFKINLINRQFSPIEIPLVLNIIDQHDRFIGRKIDAIPENSLKDGLIISSSFSRALEIDEVYEDYENFLDSCLS